MASLNRQDNYGYLLLKDINTIIAMSESTLYPILEVTITSGTVKAKEITCNQLFHTGSTGSGEYTCKGTQEDYSYDLHVTTGSINVGTTSCSSDLKIGTSEKKIYAHVSTGSVKISFID